MTRTLPTWSALVVLIVSLVVAGPASARPDGRSQLPLVWPADGTVTSPFGVWRGDRRHEGIDIGILRSLRLRAVANGVVRATGYAGGYEGYGMVVLLDLPGPYSALYAHLSDVDVRVGDRVRAGERIGLAGCTGSCTGTHLHFELKRAGAPVDPLALLP
jgi:murein DD-endopeptidase MepM/ murein hydrolase activator NlpD